MISLFARWSAVPVLFSLLAGSVSAQTKSCEPACGQHDLCVEGRCTPCVPACAANEVCTTEGCLTEEEVADAVAQAFADGLFGAEWVDAACEPACDADAVCMHGACVSPKEIPSGEQAPAQLGEGAGESADTGDAGGEIGDADEDLEDPELDADREVGIPSAPRAQAGPAVASALLGIGGAVGVAVFGGLASAAIETGAAGGDVAAVAAAGLLLAAGVASPLLADLDRSGSAPGAVGLQFAGWIGFIVSGTTALVMVATWNATPGAVLATTVLGSASLLAFGLDGLIIATQTGSATAGKARSVFASVGAGRDGRGRAIPALSFAGRF